MGDLLLICLQKQQNAGGAPKRRGTGACKSPANSGEGWELTTTERRPCWLQISLQMQPTPDRTGPLRRRPAWLG